MQFRCLHVPSVPGGRCCLLCSAPADLPAQLFLVASVPVPGFPFILQNQGETGVTTDISRPGQLTARAPAQSRVPLAPGLLLSRQPWVEWIPLSLLTQEESRHKGSSCKYGIKLFWKKGLIAYKREVKMTCRKDKMTFGTVLPAY